MRITNISQKIINQNIKNNLNTTHTGKATEAKVANYINNELGITVEQFGNAVETIKGDSIGDIDVTTKKTYIEVKKSWGVVNEKQLDKYIDPYNKDFFNFENKKVILYVDKEINKTNIILSKMKEIESKGIIIVNSLEELGKVVK